MRGIDYSAKAVEEVHAEVAHLRFLVGIKDGEIWHLKRQLGLVPAPGLFRGLWTLFRDWVRQI